MHNEVLNLDGLILSVHPTKAAIRYYYGTDNKSFCPAGEMNIYFVDMLLNNGDLIKANNRNTMKKMVLSRLIK